MMQSKPERSEGFDVIIRLAPEGILDEQHPSRPAIVPIITRNSQIRDTFTVLHSSHWVSAAASLFFEIQWALSPPLYLNKCNRTECTKWGALTDQLDMMHVPQTVKSMCWFLFDPKWAAVNDLDSVSSRCEAHTTSLREAMTSQVSNLRALLSLKLLSTN